MYRIRTILAIVRLVLLYAIFCVTLLAAAVVLRTIGETGPRPSAPLPPPTAPAMQIPFAGTNVALEQYATATQRRAALARLHAAGFGWVRQRIDWGEVELAPGTYRWTNSDAIIADVVAAALIPVVVLDGSPAWAQEARDKGNPLAPPAEFDNFARFAAAFAARYGDAVHFYQIWDEPNIAPHWGSRLVEPVDYARLLKAAATAIRTVDAGAVILLAALAPTADRGHTAIDEVTYLQRLYAAGAAPFFDAVSVEPFGFGNPPSDPRSRVDVLNFARARLIRRTMLAAGDSKTPIWAVRYGWNRRTNNTWRAVTPEAQIEYTREAMATARAHWPWMAAMGWTIDRPAAPLDDPLWGFALVTPAGEPTSLLERFRTGILHTPRTRGTPAPAAWRELWPSDWSFFVLLLLGLAVMGWRGVAALRIVPVHRWLAGYRASPPIVRASLWGSLAAVYYLATWPPLIGLCALAAAFLIWSRPLDGLFLTTLLIPFHFRHKEIDIVVATFTIPPAQAVLISTIPALVARLRCMAVAVTRKDAKIRIRTTHLDTLALAWLILSLLSSRNVWHRSGYVAGFWSLVLIPLLLYLAVRLLVHRPEELRLIIAALGLSGGLAALLGLITWIDGGGVSVDGVRRLMGLTFSPNQTALYLLRSLFVWVGLAGWKVDGCLSSRKQIHRRASSNSLNVPGSFASLHLRVEIHHLRIFAWWIVIALVVLALLLTGSRGALFLGIPAGVAALWWLRSPALRWRGPLPAAALTIVVIAGIGLWLAGDRLLNSETVLRRFAIWQGAFHLWQAHPLLGAGPGGFYWTYPAFLLPAASDEPNLLHAHNLWLNIATGWGALGLIWLVSLLLALVQRARQSQKNGRDRLHMGLLAAFAAALAHAQVDAFAVLPELAAWNWIALALLIAANQTLPSSKKTKR